MRPASNSERRAYPVVLDRIVEYALLLFAAAMPFSIALTQSALGLAGLGWLTKIIITRRRPLPRTPLDLGFGLFALAGLVSMIFSVDFINALVYYKRFLLIPIVYMLASSLDDEHSLRRIAMVFMVSVTAYSAWGGVLFVNDPLTRVKHVQNPMTTGGITMMGGLFAFSLLLHHRRWDGRRGFYAFSLLANLLCLVGTSTRSSWVGFALGAVVVLLFTHRKLLLAIPPLLVIFYFSLPNLVVSRALSIFDPHQRTNALRLEWWGTGLDIFRHYPLTGVGDISTTDIYWRYLKLGSHGVVGHFHNNLLHIAVTMGVIGLAAFLFMFYRMVRMQLASITRSGKGEAASFARSLAVAGLSITAAFFLNGLFEWNFGDAEVVTVLWFAVGLSLVVWKMGLPGIRAARGGLQ